MIYLQAIIWIYVLSLLYVFSHILFVFKNKGRYFKTQKDMFVDILSNQRAFVLFDPKVFIGFIPLFWKQHYMIFLCWRRMKRQERMMHDLFDFYDKVLALNDESKNKNESISNLSEKAGLVIFLLYQDLKKVEEEFGFENSSCLRLEKNLENYQKINPFLKIK